MPNAADPGDPAYLDSLMPWPESVPAEIRLKPKAAEEAARIADDPIVDINPSAFHDDEENRNLSELSQPKRENSKRFIVLRACFDVHPSRPMRTRRVNRGAATLMPRNSPHVTERLDRKFIPHSATKVWYISQKRQGGRGPPLSQSSRQHSHQDTHNPCPRARR